MKARVSGSTMSSQTKVLAPVFGTDSWPHEVGVAATAPRPQGPQHASKGIIFAIETT